MTVRLCLDNGNDARARILGTDQVQNRAIIVAQGGNKIAVVYNKACEGIEELADYTIQINVGCDMENIMLGLDFIMFAQTLAVMKSLSMGITPDNPCPTGEVNRVVKGVILYPYTLN